MGANADLPDKEVRADDGKAKKYLLDLAKYHKIEVKLGRF